MSNSLTFPLLFWLEKKLNTGKIPASVRHFNSWLSGIIGIALTANVEIHIRYVVQKEAN